MKPLSVEVLDIKYRRPGLSKLEFFAKYSDYSRRGTIVYDTLSQTFLSHNKDVELLAAVCISLQQPKIRKAG